MSIIEKVVLCEAVAAIIIAMIIIALAASLKMRKKGNDRLYDPYGLYAGITAAELAEIDRMALINVGGAATMVVVTAGGADPVAAVPATNPAAQNTRR